jgi:hypothetical protein
MNPLYIVQGGQVTSRTDGDVHYVSAQKLIQLYGVNPKDCRIITDKSGWPMQPGQIFLGPRYSGDYTTIPKPTIPVHLTYSFAMSATVTVMPNTVAWQMLAGTTPNTKGKRVRKTSAKYNYECGRCGYNRSITIVGMTRHWRKCAIDHDDG